MKNANPVSGIPRIVYEKIPSDEKSRKVSPAARFGRMLPFRQPDARALTSACATS